MNKKRMASLLVLAAMSVSSITAFANSWKFYQYNLTPNSNGLYEKIYYEVDDKGIATGITKADGFASDARWVFEFYERAFPHYQVERLYLDGNRTTSVARTGATADVAMEFRPHLWETKYPYRIFEALYTRLPGGNFELAGGVTNNTSTLALNLVQAKFGPGLYSIQDGHILRDTNTNANVEASWKFFGVGDYRVIDGSVVDYSKHLIPAPSYMSAEAAARKGNVWWNLIVNDRDMKNGFNARGIETALYKVPTTGMSVYQTHVLPILPSVSAPEMWGPGTRVVNNVTGTEEFDILSHGMNIVKNESLFLTGPDFATGGRITIDTVTRIVSDDVPASNFDATLINCSPDVAYRWVDGGYEAAYPHRYFEYLEIEGIPFNGTTPIVKAGTNLADVIPAIVRYTGGLATPNAR